MRGIEKTAPMILAQQPRMRRRMCRDSWMESLDLGTWERQSHGGILVLLEAASASDPREAL